MTRQALIAGGGIGGLAAALSASRAGWDVRLYERAPVFSEVGAGVQLGPNVVRLLRGWGLQDALARVAAFPERLQVRDALSGRELGVLPLGERALQKYGAHYATIHRADLHALLLEAVQARANVWLNLNSAVAGYADSGREVTLQVKTVAVARPEDATGAQPALLAPLLKVEGDALIGADGLWSRIRQQMLGDAPPRVTGHLAYRAMLPQTSLPARLRSRQVTVWLGPKLHVVHYPVRGGEWLNVVAIVQGKVADNLQSWDHNANAADLQEAIRPTTALLRDLIQAVTDGGHRDGPSWRLWPLCDRPPMTSARQHAQGRVALLGDAAHPMRPYLAQGAGMAIEDAAELGAALAQALDPALDVQTLLQRYALNRWQRNARVQAGAMRNGRVFHAEGPLRWARDASMKLLGERLLDMPWLYGAVPRVV
ncbi:FAD-dependent monooxygenase [Polaromonas naphthalenivorans]|uniref:Monooxygenase, FAD-binding protein n=1 Tax=Polaromonas naphthalenivorans (strain CJ2) TaxID=365044 RepID=A1VRP4_POLNA|nr:FAD-dependent monooxygenase [Polaromonas naphthalenivorans]ABM38322.1 monooxygenase, FAD-binding protein [Polaromonas naphthalenivorans CJ2]